MACPYESATLSLMHISETRQGDLFMFSNIFLWAFFPIVTKFSLGTISPLFSASASTIFAVLFFVIVLTIQKRWPEVLRRDAWGDIFWTSIFIGVMYYGLIFSALNHTTAGDVSILSLLEILFSFLFLALLLKHEKFIFSQFVGSLFMILGAFLILFHGKFIWNAGDLLVVLAVMIAPFGNIFQQRARHKVSSATIMFFRSLISSIFLFVLAFFMEKIPSREALVGMLPFFLINGMLMLGLSKIFWTEAIHRIPITRALSLEPVAPLLTLIFAFFFLAETPTIWQILGFLPISGGAYLILRK